MIIKTPYPVLYAIFAALCLCTALRAVPAPMQEIKVPIAPGPCEPNWKSLGDHFKVPAWWNEAKIGVWLHWGPQSVGEDGDWYAKWIYMPKYAWGKYTPVYQHHLERFGHPSEFGYKDILPLWKAEKWDPEKLMALYKRAGARYVISQGMHHDNFDLWDSKWQPWNAVKIGPQRDIVGGWEKAARKEGMKFGIAFHGDYSLWWYQPAFLSDLAGPKKGVPYDGSQNYEGKETWWKKMGLDLKDLYGIDLKEDVVVPPDWKDGETAYRMSKPLAHGIPDGDLKKNREFAVWYATKWTRRVIDAIDKYSPDFIYFDGGGSYPFCGRGTGKGLRADATPRVIAHLYNSNMAKNGGNLDVMAFAKGFEDSRAIAVNVESCVPKEIKRDQPWQTENGLGEWHYKAGTFYDSGMVIHEMLEAVAKNGNYAINIPLNPKGELDPGGEQTLRDMGEWMDVNSEGIYGSHAWDVWGEGKVEMRSGNLGPEQAKTPYTEQDIRFTTKDGAVYAFLMAWPKEGNKVLIHSLAIPAGEVSDVRLLGAKDPVVWKQTADGLEVTLPATAPCKSASCLRVAGVNGKNLKAVSQQQTTTPAQMPSVSTHSIVPLWEASVPQAKGTNTTDLPDLTIYFPAEAKSPAPAIVICPGGGYGGLAITHEGTNVAQYFQSHGVAAFVLRYRLPKNGYLHPVPLMDVQRAMRLVRSHAQEWHVDPRKIGVIGFSAGGHLASTLSTHFDSGNPKASDPVDRMGCRPDFAILVYPVISSRPDIAHHGSFANLLGPNPDPALLHSLSNETQVSANTPPTVLVHALDDKGVPSQNSELYYQALQATGVPSTLQEYPVGGHGFGYGKNPDKSPAGWLDKACDWLRTKHLL